MRGYRGENPTSPRRKASPAGLRLALGREGDRSGRPRRRGAGLGKAGPRPNPYPSAPALSRYASLGLGRGKAGARPAFQADLPSLLLRLLRRVFLAIFATLLGSIVDLLLVTLGIILALLGWFISEHTKGGSMK